MPDPEETRTITGWRPVSRLWRRPPGGAWWAALLAIPLLLGLLGWATLPKVDVNLPSADRPGTRYPKVPVALGRRHFRLFED